jgi:capsular polysaccharide biosynthesis protein/Mrp family chromosome partitioning ATPase
MRTKRIGLLSAARRWWAFAFLATGAGGLLGYVYASRIAPTYEAETHLVVDSRLGSIGAEQAASGLVPTYAELVGSQPILGAALAKLGLPLSPADLQGDVRGEAVKETRLLTIRVRDGERLRAVRLANALAAELVRYVSDNGSDRRPSAGPPDVELRIIERASDAERVRPRPGLTMEFGALAGLFGALAMAALVESLGRSVKDERDLAGIAPTVLGSVNGGVVARGARGVLVGREGKPGDVDSYRLLASRVVGKGRSRARSLLVLGAQDGDGSGAVALNLAAALTRGGTRVVLADLSDKRVIARLVDSKRSRAPSTGRQIAPIRRGGVTLDRFPLGRSRTLLLAVPRAPVPRPSPQQAQGLVDLLLVESDLLVVHAPSLRRAPGALAWAHAVDATVLVARSEHTRRRSVVAALESLELTRANVVGTVLHESRRG